MIETRDLSVAYGGGPEAVRDIAIRLAPGERVALLGPNGAGKTTLVRALTGALGLYGAVAIRGEVRIDDAVPTLRRPAHAIRRGVAAIPEGRAIIGRLTVRENLVLGASALGRADVRLLDQVWEAFPVLRDRAAQPAGLLSGGEQQMLAIGRALMSDPRCVVADELSLGLAPRITQEILDRLHELSVRNSTSVLLVEQSARRALRFADRGYVLVGGEIRAEGTSEELLADGELEREYLGMETS